MIRLMSSETEEEIGAVKSELFRAGIRSHVRKNPLTEALKLARMDLWIEKESDLIAAKKIFARMQGKPRTEHETPVPPPPPDPESTRALTAGPGGELVEESLLLEREIEEILEREDRLEANCAALQAEVTGLRKALVEAQADGEKRMLELATAKTTLEKQLAERTRSEEELKSQLGEVQRRLSASEEVTSARNKKLEAAQIQLQAQQEMVVSLRKEIVDLEQERSDNKTLLSKARAQLDLEQGSRLAAEERVTKLTQAKDRLEVQLAEQTNLHKQLTASIDSLKSLRDRLHTKRTSVRV